MNKARALALLLLLCLFAQTMVHARSASITFDEGPHLAVGYATLRTGDLRLQPVHIHPPLANVWAAAPLLLRSDLPDPRAVDGWAIASLSAITDAVVWQYPHPRGMALASRLPIIAMTLLLGAVVCRWAGDLFDRRAGLLALALYAFDPNVIAHGSLVTTDMAVTFLGTASLFFTARALRRPRWTVWAAAWAAVGLALAAKVSAVALVPVVGVLWLVGPAGRSWRWRVAAAAGGAALAGLVLWAVYGFELRALPGLPFPVPAATHLVIYRSLQEHYQLGHPSFLLGQNATHGWPVYFPTAFLLKTPLPTLLLLAASLVAPLLTCSLFPSRFRPFTSLFPWMRRWSPLLLYPLLYTASSFFSTVNIGYRHLLPLLPFLFIFISRIRNSELRIRNGELEGYGSRTTTNHLPLTTSHLSLFLLPLLLAWLAIGTVLLAPNYLTYFTPLVGGPDEGYRYLVDSNLDWGQNLWQLRDWMAENGVDRVAYAHYSPARPGVYGIDADFLPPDPRAVEFAPYRPEPGVYAIGATVLQGPYAPDVNTYAWFRTHEPLAQIGHALFVYRVPPQPALDWIAVCDGSTAAEGLPARFGRPALRTVRLDCAQSWLLPPRGAVGTVVLPPGGEAPPGAALAAQARTAAGDPAYGVYTLAGDDVWAAAGLHPLPAGASVEGPLVLTHYRFDAAGLGPGGTAHLWAVWQVADVPTRPLSLMAHLVGADGLPVAVGDGLGVPPDQMRVGDVIVQRHVFALPADLAPGAYTFHVGAYWLDSLERWHCGDTDHLVLDAVVVQE
ncbi:MAG: glycosyltransferase family 39 protein [Anaerolineae bacterium]|nr:glycosyltransferase family 39 protein [Anaerolineae bacterium]